MIPVGVGGASSAPAEVAGQHEFWGKKLRFFLLEKYLLGKLVAEDLTRIAYMHTKSGGCGLEDLSLDPSRCSGWAEHVDKLVTKEAAVPQLYEAKLPMFNKRSCGREEGSTMLYLPSVAIAKQVEEDGAPDLKPELLTPAFLEHPVVRRETAKGTMLNRIRPVALYWDGVTDNKKQTFVAMFAHDLQADVKHLVFIIRKQQLCKCGCRGWCSMWALLDVVRWDLNNASVNVYPSCKHDGREFEEGSFWHGRRGEPLGCVLAVVGLRGDWPAVAEFFSVRSWSHNKCPCFFCTVPKARMQSIAGFQNVSLDEGPWDNFDANDHLEQIRQHTITITVPTEHAKTRIARHLEYGSATLGRAITDNLDDLGLQAGDRLDPSPLLRNVDLFEGLVPPFAILFWRGGPDDRVFHESPLMGIPGVSLQLYGVDTLHCWALGCLQSYVGFVLTHIIKSNIFSGHAPWLRAADCERISLLHVKSELWQYYAVRRRTDPVWKAKGSEAVYK